VTGAAGGVPAAARARDPAAVDWNHQLADQLDWLWQAKFRPRLDGLTDEEFFWEPVPGCWSVRPHGQSAVPGAVGSGEYVLEISYPAPEPPPVTTIAWRLAHVTVAVLGERAAAHFGGPPARWDTFGYAATAAAALDQLGAAYAAWASGLRPGRRRTGPAVRPGRGPVSRHAAGRAGAAHQPRGHPPRRGDRPAA
jgi:DinB superfamily